MRRLLAACTASALACTAAASSAQAAAFDTIGGPFTTITQGIAQGSDGNMYVGQAGNGLLIKLSPSGQKLAEIQLPGNPSVITTGPSNTIWATIPTQKRLARVDVATGTVTDYATDGVGGTICNPRAVVDGGDGFMYFSAPTGCPNPAIGRLNAATGGDLASQPNRGEANDLTVASGKLFVPDSGGGVVRRIGLSSALPVDSVTQTPGGGSPSGITVAGSNIYTTLNGAGQVARFPISQQDGNATAVAPPGSTFNSPYGIAPFRNGVLAAAPGSSTVASIDGADAYAFTPMAGLEPFDIALGPDGIYWMTDQSKAQVIRFVDSEPRVGTATAAVTGPTAVTVTAPIDTRGNDTQVVLDYGPSPAFGVAAGQITIPSGFGATPRATPLAGLAPGTTYFARYRVSNARGQATGAAVSFTTPAAVTPKATKLKAKGTFTTKVGKRSTTIKSFKLTGLTGGETAKVTCSGKKKGCPKAKTYKNLKKGSRTLAVLKNRVLKPGAKVKVVVTKPGTVGVSTSLTIRSKKKPTTKRGCLAVGSTTKNVKC